MAILLPTNLNVLTTAVKLHCLLNSGQVRTSGKTIHHPENVIEFARWVGRPSGQGMEWSAERIRDRPGLAVLEHHPLT